MPNPVGPYDTGSVGIVICIDGGGSAITPGEKGHVQLFYAAEINEVTLLADRDGSIVIDIWKSTYAAFPPTVAGTITASAKPTIVGGRKYIDATLTGWQKTLAECDILAFNVDSADTIQRVLLSLKLRKT